MYALSANYHKNSLFCALKSIWKALRITMLNGKYAKIIQNLLHSKGIEKHKYASTMASILGIKYQSAKQKLDKKRSVTLSEMKKIYSYFNMSFENTRNYNGLFIMNELHVRCNIEVEPGPAGNLLEGENYATKKGNIYIVNTHDNKNSDQKYKVIRMEFIPAPRLAILDNDYEIIELLKIITSRIGIDTHTFSSKKLLLESLKSESYDCYIIDWLLDFNQTSESAIKHIREMNESVPIILLTGQLNQREQEVGNAIVEYGVELVEKPTRTLIISSILIGNLFY